MKSKWQTNNLVVREGRATPANPTRVKELLDKETRAREIPVKEIRARGILVRGILVSQSPSKTDPTKVINAVPIKSATANTHPKSQRS